MDKAVISKAHGLLVKLGALGLRLGLAFYWGVWRR